MMQTPGFEQCDDSGRVLVCRLNKALYDLKQASRAWFERFKHFLLTNLQLSVSLADSCFFIKNTEKSNVLLLVYVDDLLVTGSDEAAVEYVINQINAEFKLKDLGVLNYFLGNGCAGWG